MKLDDAINGALAILIGLAMILASQDMPKIAHIDYGPGFFPTLIGAGFVLAGLWLIVRRLAGGGAVAGLVAWRADGKRGVIGFSLILGSIAAYVLLAPRLGFLIVTPVLIFILVAFFTRRFYLALVTALLGTIVFHSFFYQLMSAPLPWGLLEPWSGGLTW